MVTKKEFDDIIGSGIDNDDGEDDIEHDNGNGFESKESDGRD